MHTPTFADGALRAKDARDCSQKQHFEEGMERTKRRSEPPIERKEQIELQRMLLSRPFGGQKSELFD